MKQLETKINRFLFLGLALAYSQDALPAFKYSIARNIRQYLKGVITQRAGMTPLNASAVAATNIHSITRLNDDTPSAAQTFARIIAGANGVVYSDNSAHTTFTSRSTAYSGNPLTFAVFRPNNTPVPYVYTGDTAKMEKIKVDGTVSKMGITPPTTAPTYAFTAPTRTSIDSFNSAAAWTSSGIAGSGALKIATTVSIGTITRILYDTGSTGFCSIQPSTTYPGITEGNRILINSGGGTAEVVIIEKVLPALTTTTISSITYDSGTTGLCTIVLAHNSRRRVQTDALIVINTEVVRILSTSIGDDDQQSFRCLTTSNHAAAEAVTGVTSVRVYALNNHAAAEALATPVLQVACTGATTGIATITQTGLTLDLSQVSGRPLQDTDEMYFAVRVTPATEVSELQILLDCGDGTFTGNFFIKSIKPSDFQSAVTQTQTTTPARQVAAQTTQVNEAPIEPSETDEQLRRRLQRRLQKAQQNNNTRRMGRLETRIAELDQPTIATPVDTATGLGQSAIIGQSGTDQWWILRFRISDLTRIGSDGTVGLKNINALRVNAFITGSTGVGDPIFQFASWWVGGTYGADVGVAGVPYTYRYRYLSSTTGARSYPSPYLRSSVDAHRQRVQLTAVASGDAQVDKIEWYRFGGSLEDWHYIGTGANSTAAFNDDFPDDAISTKPILNFDNFVPFPVADTPKTGTVTVSGTRVTKTAGDNFNTKWAEGSVIIIDGVRCTLYGSPGSTTVLNINENVGAKSGVTYYMPEPIIADTSLPAIWSSMEGDKSNVIFGCGDSFNAGTLYWTNPDDPDSASDRNYVEVCPPSEQLMNGFTYDARSYVWSSENLYQIYPVATIEGRLAFTSNITPLGRGLAGRYAFCLGEGGIWFVDKDGIYVTNGSQPISITDEDFYPLFPHDGQAGTTTNGVIAPDFTSPNNLRLAVGDGYLRFDYLGTDANRYTLVYDIVNKAWVLDQYTPAVVASYYEQGRAVHNLLLGCTDGRLYTNTGQGDGASSNTAISCQLRTKAEDLDNPRARKLWGDGSLEAEVSNTGLAITTTIGFDNYVTLLTPVANTLASANLRTPITLEIDSGDGQYGRNATLDIAWSSGTATAKIYNWSLSYDPNFVEDSKLRATPADNLGFAGNKFIQGFRITANTYDTVKAFKVQADNGTNGLWADIQSFTIRTVQEATQAFSFDPPFEAHNVRIIGNDTDDWSLLNYEFIWNPEPEVVLSYVTQPTTHDMEEYHHVKDSYIALRSSATVVLTITIDGTAYTYNIASTGGAKQKPYVPFKAIKGKYFTYAFTSVSGFKLYVKDSWVNVHDWQGGQYVPARPFGHPTRIQGSEALI